MASEASTAARRAEAERRQAEAVARISTALSLPLPKEPPAYVQDTATKGVIVQEERANWLESIANSLDEKVKGKK